MYARRPRSLGRQYERSTLLHGLWQDHKTPGSCHFPSPVQHGRTHGRLCDRDGLIPWCRGPSLHPCTISGRSSSLCFRLAMSHRLAQYPRWAEWCSMYLRSICYCHTFLRHSWIRRRRSCALLGPLRAPSAGSANSHVQCFFCSVASGVQRGQRHGQAEASAQVWRGEAPAEPQRYATVRLLPTHTRKSNQEKAVADAKKADEKKKHVELAASSMFFQHNSALGPPYRVLVDTNFINFSLQNKIELIQGMMDCLYAKSTSRPLTQRFPASPPVSSRSWKSSAPSTASHCVSLVTPASSVSSAATKERMQTTASSSG